ncbi:MAG: TonB-dependent receptor [Bryobacterales bacterium]|nr:TonB-dependent receptor [Bryobacterales bacterium]
MLRTLYWACVVACLSPAAGGDKATSRPGGSAPAPAPEASAVKAAVAPVPGMRMAASSQRNENVAVFFIDTFAAKELGVRLGANATAVGEPAADSSYFATEHGQSPSERLLLRSNRVLSGWHGELFEWHQNSIFNARTFFQVGPVKPSHRNFYGGSFTSLFPRGVALTASFSQRAIRGMVNGNVLVPLESERTPHATDPATRAIIEKFLSAYPAELPNRLDFDPRALNTNSPQRIDDTNAALRLDIPLGSRDRVILAQTVHRQDIHAFQLVAGQNPDTAIDGLRSAATWVRTIDAAAVLSLGASFQRNRSLLVSEPNAVGPRVRFGFQIEELGPDSMFPIDRTTNSYRYGGSLQKTQGRHSWHFGGDLTRFQLNGIESNNLRGYFQFTSNFGRTAIQNLLAGTPSVYEVTVGELGRGYRTWTGQLYVADRWNVLPRLQVYYGVRYTDDSAPAEVHNRDVIPYGCDCNNFSPRLSFVWDAGHGWLLRGMYTTSFSQIPPVTYQQLRNNPPWVKYIQVQSPSLLDPLSGIDLADPDLRHAPTWFSPDLVSPYSHQYNAGFERKTWAGSVLRASYIGSRTFKLMNAYHWNRAAPVPGIPLTTETVDQRRPDPRYYDTRLVVNGGIAYFDAGKVTWDVPSWRGLTAGVSYVFSKAIDEGVDYSSTAANKDLLQGRAQSEYDSLKDRRGLSNFDSTHSFLVNYMYDLPAMTTGGRAIRSITEGWQLGSVIMWKSGTPLTLYVGSDSPGYGNVDGGPSDRPNILDPSILGMTISNPEAAAQILRRDRFSYIRPGDLRGNLGRGAFRKATIWNWNASVSKQWRFHAAREWSAILRGEVYNLTNTPQFDEPQRNYSAPAFGKITNALNDGRAFQVGVRFVL